MRQTYDEAMVQVYKDEGGYTNDAADSGGPTNYGITIHDARTYWKADATADDVRNMPKAVAADIYAKHYANPIHYDELPAGVDYAIFDYGINSGVSRSVKVAQGIVGVHQDGGLGPTTLSAIQKYDPTTLVNAIYAERLNFLQHLGTWSTFGKGWTRRCSTGKKLSLSLISKYKTETQPKDVTTTSIQPKKETTTMMINWKTTVAGITAIITALGTLFTANGMIDWSHLSTVLPAIFAAVGLMFAKDSNVTGAGTTAVAK